MSKEIHIFARNGYESTVVAVEADSETEARGIMQKKTTSGIDPEYQGTISELSDEDGFVMITRL